MLAALRGWRCSDRCARTAPTPSRSRTTGSVLRRRRARGRRARRRAGRARPPLPGRPRAGPPADLAAWSGLPLRDARAGLKAIASELTDRDDDLVDLAAREPAPDAIPARLLGAFDPYLLGWKDRAFAVPARYTDRVHPGGGMLRATATVDGLPSALGAPRAESSRLEPFGRLPAERAGGAGGRRRRRRAVRSRLLTRDRSPGDGMTPESRAMDLPRPHRAPRGRAARAGRPAVVEPPRQGRLAQPHHRPRAHGAGSRHPDALRSARASGRPDDARERPLRQRRELDRRLVGLRRHGRRVPPRGHGLRLIRISAARSPTARSGRSCSPCARPWAPEPSRCADGCG